MTSGGVRPKAGISSTAITFRDSSAPTACFQTVVGKKNGSIGTERLTQGYMHESQIEQVLEQLRVLEHRFSKPKDSSIPSLDGTDRAKFMRLVIEAKSLVDAGLGGMNDFSVPLLKMQNLNGFGAWNPPTPDELLEAIALVEGGLNQVRRKKVQPTKASGGVPLHLYVDAQRILEMQAVHSAKWDLRKLVRMLQEINLAHVNEMHMVRIPVNVTADSGLS